MSVFKRTKLLILAASLAALALLVAGCEGEGNGGDTGTFTDNRDGKRYKKVTIAGTTWMARNLDYQPSSGNSWCDGDDPSQCDTYGRLYDWETAMTACPSGWHLPSREEWGDLAKAAGGLGTYGDGGAGAGTKLKSSTGWISYPGIPVGTDVYGFSAIPGGLRRSFNGNFYNVGDSGGWWTATETEAGGGVGVDGDGGSDAAFTRDTRYDNERVGEYKDNKGDGFSVRCVEN